MHALDLEASGESPLSNRERPPSANATVVRGATTWNVQPQCAELLLGEDGLRLREWQQEQRLEVVKSGPHRTVYRLDLPNGRFYIKHYKVPDLRALLQNLVRPCKALREWRAVTQVVQSGIPTFEPVAVGRTTQGGLDFDNYLVSRAIEDAQTLDVFLTLEFPRWPAARQARLRQELARALGALAAQMHAAGLVHYDFHAGNILLRVLPLDRVRMWVIDLHAVQCTTRPSLEMVKQNLAVLNQFFVGRGTRTDRLRFWTSYTAARSALGSHELAAAADETQAPALVRDMELSCQRAAVHMWRRADRHWARGNRHVLKLDTPHIRCRGVATLGSELLTEIRDAPDALFAERVEYWCKKSGTNRVAAVTLPIGGENRLCFWKLSQTRRIWPWLVCLVRGARVRAAWEIGHALLRRGIATPKPLAFVEARDGITLRQYLLTEGIPHSATVAKFLGDPFGRLAPHEQRQWLAAFLKRLAGQVRRLHSFGFDHRDLKASNILVCENPADSRLWLLDLDSVRRWTWLPPPRRVQNLARLNVSSRLRPMIRNSDRLRFLIAYLGTRRKAEWKSLWKKIARRSARKVLHNQRTGRPLT